MTWAAAVLTLYPEMFPGPLGVSLAGRALDAAIWSLAARNIRDFATDRHRTVDDTPAGGGPGMVLRVDVLRDALRGCRGTGPVLVPTPRGTPLTQARVRSLAAGPGVTIVCGRFEGFDERLFTAPLADGRTVEPVSIGDYVLSGGEPAALVVLDACVRLLPGVMGATQSGESESFESGLARIPALYPARRYGTGRSIPEVLRSGGSREDRCMAAFAVRGGHTATAAGPVGALRWRSGSSRPLARGDEEGRMR